ncbi:MAG: phosphopantetheine-binding protein [Acidobacteriota bacterium]|jgi:acyl carrier protein
MEELKDQLRRLIVERLRLEQMQPHEITDDMALFGEGLGLDSIDALELVVALEKEFGVKIEDQEVGVQAFRNISSLADFIQKKTGVAS